MTPAQIEVETTWFSDRASVKNLSVSPKCLHGRQYSDIKNSLPLNCSRLSPLLFSCHPIRLSTLQAPHLDKDGTRLNQLLTQKVLSCLRLRLWGKEVGAIAGRFFHSHRRLRAAISSVYFFPAWLTIFLSGFGNLPHLDDSNA